MKHLFAHNSSQQTQQCSNSQQVSQFSGRDSAATDPALIQLQDQGNRIMELPAPNRFILNKAKLIEAVRHCKNIELRN